MRWFRVALLIPVVTSCVATNSEMLGDGERGSVAGGEECELMREEFEGVERLKEDPIDPRKAGVAELLSIPGFPRELALAVKSVIKNHRSGASWLEHLSPPDRELVYRYREFLILPARKPNRFKAKMLAKWIGPGEYGRYDLFSSLVGDRLKIIVRGRVEGDIRHASFFVSKRVFAGSVCLHAGDFMPDFAMGLAFSGYFQDYPFSGGYPLRGYRWMTGRTSFYGTSFRGFSGEMWRGPMRVLFFTGWPRSFTAGVCRYEDRPVRGGRIEISLGGGEAGATAYIDPLRGGLIACDGRLRFGDLACGYEAVVGARRNAATWGISYKTRALDAGFVLHVFPNHLGNRFGASPGSGGGSSRAGRGVGLVVCRSLPRAFTVRASFERYARYYGSQSQCRDVFRAGILKKWKKFSMEASLKSKRYGLFQGIPYPTDEVQPGIYENTAKVNMMYTRRRAIRFKVSGSCPWGDGHAGLQVSPSLRLRLFAGSIDVTAFFSMYRSITGMPAFYYYEPSLEGTYPWKVVRGDGSRGVLEVTLSTRTVSLSWRLAVGSQTTGDMSICAAVEL